MATAGSIVVELLAKTGSFETDIDRATRSAERRFKEMEKTIDLWAARSVAAIGVTTTAVLAWTAAMAKTGHDIDRLATLSNTSAETFQKWAHSAKTVGIEQQKLADIFKDMQDRVGDFLQTGGGPLADFFDNIAPKVGVTIEQFRNLSGPQALGLFVQSLEKANLSQSEMVFYMEAIASDSSMLLPLLKNNAAGFKSLGDEAERVGTIMSDQTIRAATELERNISRLNDIVGAASITVANQFLPTLNNFIDRVLAAETQTDGLATEIKDLAENTAFKTFLESSLVGLARVADVAVAAAKAVYAVAGSFAVVGADIEAFVASTQKNIVNLNPFASDAEYQQAIENERRALSERNDILDEAGKRWNDLWNTQFNRFEQAALMSINTITVVSDKIATVDLTIPTGPTEQNLKKLAEWMDKLATPGEKLASVIAKAKKELGSLYTPEIEARIVAMYNKKAGGISAVMKAQQQFEQERQRSLQAQYDEIAKLDEQATALERQALYFGYSEQALNALTIAELEHQRAALVGRTGAEEQIAILDRQIDAYKRMGMAMGDIATKEQQKADWEAWARDVDQIFQQVGQSLTDAIFEGGKSGKQLIEDLFKTLTLRVLVQPVMGALQGAVTQTLGSALGIGGAQGGGVGGLLSGASNLSSLYSAVTGGIVESMASGAVAIGKTIGSSALTSFGLGMSSKSALSGMGIMGAEAMSGATAATGSAAAGGAAGAGQAFAAAAPYLAGAAALAGVAYSAFSLGSKEVTGQGMAGWVKGSRGGQDVLTYETATRKGGWARGDSDYLDFSAGDAGMQSAIGQLVTETSQSLKAYADALNLNTQDIQEYAKHIFIPTMDRSAEEIQQNILSEVNLYAQELTRDFWPALQEVRRGGEELTDTLARVATAVQGVNPVLEALGLKAYDVSLQGGVLASSLVDLFGGMEGFATATSSYYDAFYSEQEKFDLAAQRLAQSLSSVGVVMPDLTQTTDAAMSQFRALVEAQDLTSDAGQRAFAVLTQAAGGFAELTQAAESLGIAAVDAAAAVEDASAVLRERDGLERQLAIAVGGVAKQREFELAALHESNRAIQAQIWALEDAATAAQNAASAEQARVSQVLSLQTQIDQAMGNTLAIRQRELAALDPISAMLQQHVYDLQDWQDKANRQYQDDLQRWQGLQQAVGTAFQEVQRIASAELAKLRDAARATDTALGDLGKRVSAQTGLLGRYISGLEGISSSLKSVFDFLEDQIRDLRQQAGAGGMYARQGWQLIGNALTTGVIPDADKLSQAVSAVRDDMAGKQYGSAFERDREALILANRLEALQGVTEPQMTLAEQQIAVSREQLAKLQAIFDEAEKTVNASRGIVDNTGDLGPAGEQVDKLSELWAESQTQVLALADIFGNTSYTKDLYESVLDAVTYESWAEKQIEGINAQLAIAQQQLDAFNGVSAKATTMIQAMNNMASALSAAQVAQPTQPTPTQPGQTVTPPPTNPLAGYILSPTAGLTEAQMKGKRLYRPRDFTEGDAYMKAHADVYAAYLQAVQQGWAERSSAGIRVFAQQHWDQYGSKEGVARAYADGGYYPGGMALVGEEGPELINFARPGQVYTAGQTQDILSRMMRPAANDGALLGRIDTLIAENRQLRQTNEQLMRTMIQMEHRIARQLERWETDGMPGVRDQDIEEAA